jgi:transcriptional regulator with XRE-family HTH domain
MADPQFFTAPDGTEMVILTRARFEALLAAEEDVDDLAAAQEGAASLADEGGIPLDVMTAIQGGAHPIAAWRKHRGLTQAALADACDPPLTQGAITRLEKTEPGAGRPETLAAIAAVLDAPRWTLELRPHTSVGRSSGPRVLDAMDAPPAREAPLTRAAVTSKVWDHIRGGKLVEEGSIAEQGAVWEEVPLHGGVRRAGDIHVEVHEALGTVAVGEERLFDAMARLDKRPYSAVFGSGEDQPKLGPLLRGELHRDAATGEFAAKARPARKAKKRA